jgi:hypothetical protein
MPLLLGQALHVGREIDGYTEPRRRHQPRDPGAVPPAAEHQLDDSRGRRILRHIAQQRASDVLVGDPPGKRLGGLARVRRRRDEILLVGELAAREGERAIGLARQRGDARVADRERQLLTRIVRAGDLDPIGRQENARRNAPMRELRPRTAKRGRIARDTRGIGCGEDPSSLGRCAVYILRYISFARARAAGHRRSPIVQGLRRCCRRRVSHRAGRPSRVAERAHRRDATRRRRRRDGARARARHQGNAAPVARA